jgi:hypothetical protein
MDVYEAVDTRRAVRAFSDEREYPMYPDELASPYLDRFAAAAAQRYRALGIERDDPHRPEKIGVEIVGADGGRVLFCGVAVGFEQQGAPPVRTARADIAETVTFIGI